MPQIIGSDQFSSQGLPPVSLPQMGAPPPDGNSNGPLKIEVSRAALDKTAAPPAVPSMAPAANAKGGNWWDQYPDAPAQSSAASPKQAAAPDDSNAGSMPNTAQNKGNNWWDQYPDAPQQASASADESTPPQKPVGVLEDMGKSALQGAAYGLTGAVTFPLDVANMGLQGGTWLAKNTIMRGHPELQNLVPDAPQIPGTKDIVDFAQKHLFNLPPYEPQTLPGRFVSTGANFLGGGAPSIKKVKDAGNLLAAAIGSESLGEASKGTPLEPVARIAGALGGHGIASTIGGAKNAVATTLGNAGIGKADIINGVRATKQQQMTAGQKIVSASENPEALQRNLGLAPDGMAEAQPFVPNSKPTLADVAQDGGISEWQRQQLTKNPSQFNARGMQNQNARNANIGGISEGNPNAVGQHFTQQLEALESQVPALETARAQQQAATHQAVADETGQLGGAGTPEEYGATTRSNLQNAAKESKDKLSALWKALEPYDDVQVNGHPIQQAVAKVIGGVNKAAGQQLAPQESRLFGAVAEWGDHPTFGTLRDLRSEIASAQRELRFTVGDESQEMRRLSILKNSVDKAISDAVEGVVHDEQQAVAAGTMQHENSLAANLARMQDAWYAQQNVQRSTTALQERISNRTAGGFGPASVGNDAARPVKTVSGVGGAKSAPGVQSGNAARDTGVPGASEFDAAGQQQYRAAREATVEHKSTYRQGAVGNVLAAGKNGAQFNVPDALVGKKIFHNGPTSPADIRAYLKATKSSTEAIQSLRDEVMSRLRDPALDIIRPDGSISAKNLSRWVAQHQKAINALSEADPTFSAQLKKVQLTQEAGENAQSLIENHLADAKAKLIEFQKDKAASFIHDDPLNAVQKAFNAGSPEKAFASLVEKVKGSAEATEGLRRAVVDYVLQRVRGVLRNDEMGADLTSAKNYQKFIEKNRDALIKVLGGQGMHRLDMVAADIRRYTNSVARGKIAGQSNTAQDLAGAAKYGEKPSVLSSIMEQVREHSLSTGAVVGQLVAHAPVIGAIIAKTAASMKMAGIKTVEDLQLEAALHPEIARILVQKAGSREIPIPVQKRLGAAIMKTLPPAVVSQQVHKGEKK